MKAKMWNEFRLIDRLRKDNLFSLSSALLSIGDDGAVIAPPKNNLIFTCDTQVEGVHFKRKHVTPQQIAERAIAAAISDLAAMGAVPRFLLTTLFLPPKLQQSYVYNLSKGLTKASKQNNIQIIGGNITKSSFLAIDVFVIGESNRYITRNHAQIGDAVCVTGTLGNAHAALLQEKYFKITPRIEEGKFLAREDGVTAMIDISDGLSSDLLHICRQSKVGVEIFLEKLPRHKSTPVDFALHGGEDYELCFTTKPEHTETIIKTVKKHTGTNITVIGTILPKAKGMWLIQENGKRKPLKARGWIHSS